MSELMFLAKPPAQTGFVWLVGAGPGAADLITLRGKQALESAEVVIYDELAGKELLEFCRADCEVIHVGKRAGCHSATQAEINRLLVEHALAGRRIVRLKGGDPSVFGRLGEELEALREAGIPHSIVPGVTAACAAAAAAGISLTQRGISSSAVLATGHECAGKPSPGIAWESLARPGTTVCVYMGTRSLGTLAARLLGAGHAPDTPLAIVSHTSLPSQRIRTGTLSDAEALAEAAQGAPSLIIIGEVVAASAATPAHLAETAHV